MAKIIKVDIENFSYGEETILQDIHFSVEKAGSDRKFWPPP